MDAVTQAKKSAAIQAVDNHVSSGQKIGIGSGSTVVFAVEHLAQKYHNGTLQDIICVPSSFQARQLILENKLPLAEINQEPILDVDIDGADEIDDALNLIKGGGGCHLQEKIVAACAKVFVIIADYRKDSTKLGEQWKKGIPLEVSPLAYRPVMEKLTALGGKPILRLAKSKAGPSVSDNGNFIIDVDFGILDSPAELNQTLISIPGVLESGLFIKMACTAYIGMADGSVKVKNPEADTYFGLS